MAPRGQGQPVSSTPRRRPKGAVLAAAVSLKSKSQGRGLNLSDEKRCPFAGNKTRILRTQRNWTLKNLAELAGVPLNTAWRLEHGMSPVLANAMKVASVFGLTIYEVWNIPGPHIIPWVAPGTEKRNKLRILRTERCWTLDELAKRCGIPRSTIAQIERDTGPTLTNAVLIAAAFGVSVYDIWSIPKKEIHSVSAGAKGMHELAKEGSGRSEEEDAQC